MIQENTHPSNNLLLAALPADELEALLLHGKVVSLDDKQLIYEQDSRVDAVYFPLTGAISMLTKTADASAVEVAVVGKQGFVGLSPLFEAETSFAEAIVQVPGYALRLPVAGFGERIRAMPTLTTLLLRYAQFFFKEAFVSNGCNRFHNVEQRISRWLLAHRVRTYKTVFPFTHEFLAYLLGAQRSTVSQITGELQKKGLIRYSYGEMAIVNSEGLESTACECFGRVRQELDCLLTFYDRIGRTASPPASRLASRSLYSPS